MVRRASARGILLIPFRTLMASPSKDSGAFNEGSTLRPFASIRSTSDESESTSASSPRSSISPGLASLSVSFPPRATRFPSGTRTIREMIGAAKSRRPTRPHICGRTRRGGFLLRRQSRRDRMRAKLHELKEELRRRRHSPIPEQGRWLRRGVAGWYNYHAVPTNVAALSTFQHHVGNLWRRALQRRSQEGLHDVGENARDHRPLAALATRPPSVASNTFRRQITKVGAGCLNRARPVLCGGRSVMSVPTAIDTNSPYQSIRPPCGFLPRLPGRTVWPSFISTIAMKS